MLLRNFSKVMHRALAKSNDNEPAQSLANVSVSFNSGNCAPFRATTDNLDVDLTTPYSSTSTNGINSCCIIVGTGSTPATLDDYNLGNYIYLPSTSRTITFTGVIANSNSILSTITHTFVNNTTEAVTIKEVGVVGVFLDYGVASSPQYLLSRTVLDTPVTIPVGETRAFSVSIDFMKLVDNLQA